MNILHLLKKQTIAKAIFYNNNVWTIDIQMSAHHVTSKIIFIVTFKFNLFIFKAKLYAILCFDKASKL